MSSNAAAAWLEDAFQLARDEFLKNVKRPQNHDIFKFSSIDDVYEAADDIQKQQAKTKTLRGLQRLEPLLQTLKEFSGTVEVFIQAKPEILALIWGPLKLILQLANSLTTMFGKVVQVLADIGGTLPLFQKYAPLLEQNEEAKRILCLFYIDILECYTILLHHIHDRRMKDFLEVIWPNTRSKLDVVQKNIEYHRRLMTDQVTLEDILQSFNARKDAMHHYEQAQVALDEQKFSSKLAEISPLTYERRLYEILQGNVEGSGKWLFQHDRFKDWSDLKKSSCRCLWLCGIPGSGKTVLTANAVRHIESSFDRVLYVFLSHNNQERSHALDIYHSLLFQAAKNDRQVQSYLLAETADANSRKFGNDFDYVKKLTSDVLGLCDSTAIVIDGLDEIKEDRRQRLLSAILETSSHSPNAKILFSSRDERDIRKKLENKSIAIRVDHHNTEDIRRFANQECKEWVADLEDLGADEEMMLAAQETATSVVQKSNGMFLYAKLVLLILKDQLTADDIRNELSNLPDGLHEAYGRILDRIRKDVSPVVRTVAHTVLQWMTCAHRLLSEQELLQILVIMPGTADFTKGRKATVDIRKACGPIVEVVNGVFQFVHFTAREYLVDKGVGFLDPTIAQFDAAAICATYLQYTSLDILFKADATPPELDQAILQGDFVFFDYASTQLFSHLANLGPKEQASTQNLSTILNKLLSARSINSLDKSTPPASILHRFRAFKEEEVLQRTLARTFVAYEREVKGLTDEEADPSQRDPIQLTLALGGLRQRLEVLHGENEDDAPNGKHARLSTIYGRPRYCCSQIFCPSYQIDRSFLVKRTRDIHQLGHIRPYQCRHEGCVYFDRGFRSERSLAKHESSHHPESNALGGESRASNSETDRVGTKEERLLLEDSIINSDLDSIRALSTEHPGLVRLRRPGETYTHASSHYLYIAAWKSTPEALECLLSLFTRRGGRDFLNELLAVALETKNYPNIKFLIAEGADVTAETGIYLSFASHIRRRNRIGSYLDFTYRTNMSRALSLWDPDLMDFLVQKCSISPLSEKSSHSTPFADPAIRGLSYDEVADLLERMREYADWHSFFDDGVIDATRSCSKIGLQICLENKGNANGIFKDEDLITFCAKKGTTSFMELIPLLLKHGASAELKIDRYSRSPLWWIKKCETYFGLPWNEVVRRCRGGEALTGSR